MAAISAALPVILRISDAVNRPGSDLSEYVPADHFHADCCDVVQVAVVLSRFGTPEFASAPKLASLPAFAKLELGELTPDGTLAVIDEADAAIAALEKTLAP